MNLRHLFCVGIGIGIGVDTVVAVQGVDSQSPINVNPDLASSTASGSVVTPGPTVDATRLLGWYQWDGQWYSSECMSGSVFKAHSTLAGCHASENSAYATACEGNQVAFNDGGKKDCDLDRCETATLFGSKDAPASSLILCYATAAFREEPRTFYRNTFALSSNTGPASQATTTHSISRTPVPSVSDELSSISSVGGSQPTQTSHATTPAMGLSSGMAVWIGMMTVLMVVLGMAVVL